MKLIALFVTALFMGACSTLSTQIALTVPVKEIKEGDQIPLGQLLKGEEGKPRRTILGAWLSGDLVAFRLSSGSIILDYRETNRGLMIPLDSVLPEYNGQSFHSVLMDGKVTLWWKKPEAGKDFENVVEFVKSEV